MLKTSSALLHRNCAFADKIFNEAHKIQKNQFGKTVFAGFHLKRYCEKKYQRNIQSEF